MNKILGFAASYLVKAYQLVIGPFLPKVCRYYPTCSQYSLEAYRRYGMLRGTSMTLKRLGRCHPWHPGGYDPVE